MNAVNFYNKIKNPIKSIFLTLGKVYSFILGKIDRLIEPYLQFKYSDIARKAISHLITTILSVFLAYLTIFKVVPTVMVFTYEMVVISTMAKTDTFIFSKTEEVEGKPGEHRVYACRQTPCQAQFDSVEYRIEDSLFMDSVYLIKHGIPYDPGELAGAFLGETNICEVRWYGQRRKFLGFYPKIIGASCQQAGATQVVN